ncbi:MAG: mannose-1-phosphate guanylyltransferase, partial [Planctomycetota bacterium]
MAAPALQIAVLAGGSGTRFWPVGRTTRPKQFLALDGRDPRALLDLTLTRVEPLARRPAWIIAPAGLSRGIRRLLPAVTRDALLLEPRPRNTAAALCLAALRARHEIPGGVLLIVPADHHVAPVGRYRTALRAMARQAGTSGSILTLGLRPRSPATGYGYLRLGKATGRSGAGRIHRVERYIEKPSLSRARRLVADGRHLWNGGTFAFRPDVFLEEAERVLPDVAKPLGDAFEYWGTRRFAPALRRAYAAVPSISVDYGVMEKARRVEALAADFAWDDLGSWDAVARHRPADRAGNRVRGEVTLLDAKDCVVEAADGHVALLGVEDLIVV